MKKLILSLFVIAAFSASSFAQLSLKAGVNIANQTFEFFLGANYKVNLSESIGLRPGIQFSLKGSKLDFGGTDVSESDFSYLEVPVDLVFTTGGISIHAGPYLGLLMSAKSDGVDVKDDVKSTDFGLNLGLGYNFGKIGVGANYGLGLSNISQDEEGTAKNKVISVYVTYTL